MLALKMGHGLTRPKLISAVFFIAFLNGVSEIVFRSIKVSGFTTALEGTFSISVIVLVCLYLTLENIMLETDLTITPSDWRFFSFCSLLVAIPHPSLSWIAITAVAAREYFASTPGSVRRRAAVLMFGITIPMFWGRLVFTLMSSWLLKGDALLVSLVTHTASSGNVVTLSENQGFLWVAAPCSSFANISLAMLCWMMFTEYAGRPRTKADYFVCFNACLNVVMINVARISLIAKRPDLYDLLHGPVGSTVASYLSAFAVLAVCALGVKRESSVTQNVSGRPADRLAAS